MLDVTTVLLFVSCLEIDGLEGLDAVSLFGDGLDASFGDGLDALFGDGLDAFAGGEGLDQGPRFEL
jgi:hypothetical protein